MSVRTSPRSRVAAALTSLLVAGSVALAGCSDEGDSSNSPAEGASRTIKVTLTDDQVSPKGERVKIDAGKPVKIEITADHEGALHVHSTPEQSLDFVDGTVTRELVIDRPGVVEVESHDPDLVILQLQVS